MLSYAQSNSLNQQVRVTTSARLHMGFYDLTGTTGSMFGGLGLAIDSPCTQVQISESKNLIIDAKSSDSVAKIVENLIKSLNLLNINLPNNFSVKILQSIPEHAGLGSGTQMALAIGAALNQLFGLNLTIAQIASAAMRGKRSGIGIGAFAQGGFLVDSGKLNDEIPGTAMRHTFPNDWRILLVLDSTHTGVHGAAELQAFQTLAPAKSALRSMVFERMLPALQRSDLLTFGVYMQELQAYNGDYFTPIQGGRYASRSVELALAWLKNNGAPCTGQSSWGPTGFAILRDQQQAERLQAQAQLAFVDNSNISFKIVRGKNTGASDSGIAVSEVIIKES